MDDNTANRFSVVVYYFDNRDIFTIGMTEKEKNKLLKSLKQSKKNKLYNDLVRQGRRPIVMSKKQFKRLGRFC